MNRLVIIDGNAVLHRAYHALPPLTAPDGSIVNAVYGFTTMLFRLFKDLKPTHMAVCFDRKAPTFRKKMYKSYQVTRPVMDNDLVSQVPKVHELVASFDIPIYEKDGFEADDCIGTIVDKVKSKKLSPVNIRGKKVKRKFEQIIIVTGDKDILQLTEEERILVYMPIRGLSEAKLYGEEDTKKKLGVPPDKVIDLKGFAGDPSDNYPGVAGIGPKTAVSLIEKYGTVEGLYHALKEGRTDLSETVKQKLKKGKKDALLSKDLATIRINVPIKPNIEKMVISTLDTDQAREFLEKYHFFSLLKRLDNLGKEKIEINKTEKKEKKKDKKGNQQSLF